jgi:hypothetical protein
MPDKGESKMSNVTRWTITVAMVAAFAALTGCAKPPQAEMDAVKQAVNQAEAAEADIYAPVKLEEAREAERAAIAEIEAQNARFALSRSYETAVSMLKDAEDSAEDARATAVANREAAMTLANEAVESFAAQLATAEADLAALAACRKAPKGFAQDLELMRGKVEALSGQLTELESAVDGERYLDAAELAKSMKPEMETVTTDLSTARTKLGC